MSMSDPVKKTLEKYYLNSDGTLKTTSMWISFLTVVAVVIMAREMWPLSVDDVLRIAAAVSGGGTLLGFRGAMKKDEKK